MKVDYFGVNFFQDETIGIYTTNIRFLPNMAVDIEA
jgi:hypothetical protein